MAQQNRGTAQALRVGLMAVARGRTQRPQTTKKQLSSYVGARRHSRYRVGSSKNGSGWGQGGALLAHTVRKGTYRACKRGSARRRT